MSDDHHRPNPDPGLPAAPDPYVHPLNRPVVAEFRANGGRVGAGGDLLLLTTVGARTGRYVTVPLGYVRDGDRWLVVGSAGGSPRHPAWYHNLLAHPMVRVEVGTETFAAVAVPADGIERDNLFDRIVRVAPGYRDYQDRVSRRLPVVVLERSDPDGGAVTTFADKLVQIHTWLRGQLRYVRAETEAYLAGREATGGGQGPPVGLSLQIRQHCLAFCDALGFHHGMEDTQVLPDLERRHPHLRGAVERLRVEHRAVGRIQAELAALLVDVRVADPRRFRTELDRMAGELEAHLDHEEDLLVPLFADVPFPPGPAPGRS